MKYDKNLIKVVKRFYLWSIVIKSDTHIVDNWFWEIWYAYDF